MSSDYDDYREEAYLDELYQEVSIEAIEKFQADRLRSFYLANPLIAKNPFECLGEARKLLLNHPSAAQLFAMTAIEVGLKLVFVKPIVYGLVHTEPVAAVVAEIVMKPTSLDHFRDLIWTMLADKAAVDLKTYVRPEARKALWQEIKDVQEIRNKILHRAELCDEQEAKQTIAIASVLWESLFPSFVRNLGLHLHEGVRFCDNEPCFDDAPVMFPHNSAVVLPNPLVKAVRNKLQES